MTLLGRRNDLAISPIEYPLSRRISISRRSALVMRDHFSFFSCAHSNRWRSNFKDNLPGSIIENKSYRFSDYFCGFNRAIVH